MSNYKFLLHDPENKPAFLEWQFIPPITEDDIAKIPDSLVETTSTKIGTSIPTPLARLFTFQTAFNIVNKQLLAGDDVETIRKSVYGGVVSDCLDFLEWIFVHGIDNFAQMPINLSDGSNLGTTNNLKALSKAINSTVRSYFNGSLAITLFRHKASGKIVGGTSPYSLLYTSPNWRREIREIGLTQLRGLTPDVLFDPTFCLLHGRDIKFISYLYGIVRPVLDSGNNTHPLKSFADYVSTTIARFKITPVQIQTTDLGSFSPCSDVSFGFKQIKATDRDLIQSDFYLDKNLLHITGGKKPLVLASTMTLQGQYVNGVQWNKDKIVNFNSPSYHTDLNQRILPGCALGNYPFIIDSDLFQPNLIDVSYDINPDFFHTISSAAYGTRFLLPVKPLFFEIIGLDSAITDYLTITEARNTITINLTIPIIGTDSKYQARRYVVFSKEYNIGLSSDNDIKKSAFELAFFPFFRRKDEINKNGHKKVVLWLERSNTENKVSNILFYDNNFDIIGDRMAYDAYTQLSKDDTKTFLPREFPLKYQHRMSYNDIKYNSKYFATNADYRMLEVKLENGSGGLLVPKFIEKSGHFNKKYKYAIDFGTTNTHIEYAELDTQGPIEATKSSFKVETANNVPKATEKPLVVLMHKHSENLGELDKVYPVLMREFMPPSIGNSANTYNIQFPTRSVVLDFKEPNSDEDSAFLSSNIAFKIGEKDDFHPQAVYTPDLKWLLESATNVNKGAYKQRIRMFFEQLFYMIRYKAIMDDCDESNLKICFTRPMSMKGKTLNGDIQEQIKKAIKKVFPPEIDPDDTNRFIFELDESLAPYEDNKLRFTTLTFCNIDIGGGTTDMLFGYKINEIDRDYNFYLSSVKFAGNDLWGNSVNPKLHNGIIQYFVAYASRKSEKLSDDHPYKSAYTQFLQYYNRGLSDSELISVIFKNNSVLNFTENIFTDCRDFKLLLFIHYSAIVYYANFVFKKYQGLDNPKTTISLSGNGSLYLNLISAAGISNFLFNRFSGGAKTLEGFVKVENPKEITARGALTMQKIMNETNADDGKDPLDKYDDSKRDRCVEILEHTTIENISNSLKMTTELAASLDAYFTVVLDILKNSKSVKADFGDTSRYHDIFTQANYKKYIAQWLSNERPDLTNIDSVFFKPIRYILFDLSIAIYEKNKIT